MFTLHSRTHFAHNCAHNSRKPLASAMGSMSTTKSVVAPMRLIVHHEEARVGGPQDVVIPPTHLSLFISFSRNASPYSDNTDSRLVCE